MKPSWIVKDLDADLCRLNDLLGAICAIQFELTPDGSDHRVDNLLWIAREISEGIVDHQNRKYGIGEYSAGQTGGVA